MLEVLAGLAGLAIVVLTLTDVFQTVIVPRSVGSPWRLSVRLTRTTWPLWRAACLRIGDAERREDLMAMFAPWLLVTQIGVWGSALIIGYGLMFWSFRHGLTGNPGLGGALYFSGTTMLTIGFGDIAPVGPAARALSIFCASSGLGMLGICTTFLFQVFGSFQRREAFIQMVSERTGAPPSGLEFIVRHYKLGLVDDIGTILRDSQRWIAETMETHLAYPSLTYFRSSHDDESWVGTLGALLDASTLLLTTVQLDHRGQAELTYRAGRHLVHDFSSYFRLPGHDSTPIVEHDEFIEAYRTMNELGIPLAPLEDAWPAFNAKRETYAEALDKMARWWRIPPARWIGDRSRVRVHVNVGVPR